MRNELFPIFYLKKSEMNNFTILSVINDDE